VENLSMWMAAIIIERILLWSSITLLYFLPAAEVPLVKVKEFIAVWMHTYISASSVWVWSPLNTLHAGITLTFLPSLSNLILVKYTFSLSKELECFSNTVIVPTIITPKPYKRKKERPFSKTRNSSQTPHTFVGLLHSK